MKKFVVETYYTCTFKTVHTLDNLDDAELSKIDARTDGDVEVIDVKLNNRKTKKIGGKKEKKIHDNKIKNDLPKNVINKIKGSESVAYMQVKDLTKNQDEKVFIFNGWTFSSDSSLTPFDHAIYDLKLLNCNKA